MLESTLMSPVIKVQDVTMIYRGQWPRQSYKIKALQQVNLLVGKGETMGLVGESGSGKSTLGKVLLRLIQPISGMVRVNGCDPFGLKGTDLNDFRRNVQAIFQDSGSSLNPRLRISQSIREGLDIHRIGSTSQRAEQVNQLLEMVGLDADYANRYPHTLSGGQRQRVNIARALALKPQILIADEPVSALDTSIQAQILDLMIELRTKSGLTMIFISHDIRVVRALCDRVAVMHQGRIVEQGYTQEVFDSPQHSYTRQLIESAPVLQSPKMSSSAHVTAINVNTDDPHTVRVDKTISNETLLN